MKMTKIGVSVLAVVASASLRAAVPEVTNVTMVQPSDGRLVTISYTLNSAPAVVTLDVQTNYTESGTTKWASIGGTAVCNATGDVWKRVDTGSRTILWRPDLSWPDHKIADGGARAVVTAWSLDNTPDYMVVDLTATAAPNTQRYYPSVDFLPGGILGNPDYRTSLLVMRKIMAKDITWTMGSPSTEFSHGSNEEAHLVTLTNNYYIGLFEVTQSQWGLVATNSTAAANFTAENAMRPMEKVCYDEIRLRANSSYPASADEINQYSWPFDPLPGSFLGLLRLKTGLDFDLPSEAQWEFAAHAGHGTGYWNDGSPMLGTDPDANFNRLARNLRNNPGSASTTATLAPSEGGTDIVGSHAPSSLGLYDMHGNVFEWCLDWYEANIATATDAQGAPYKGRVNIDPASPTLPLSGTKASNRVIKGGSWNYGPGLGRPAYRLSDGPSHRYNIVGFRVVCTAGLK